MAGKVIEHPLFNASCAQKFLEDRALRHFVGRIPGDRRYTICLATVEGAGTETHDVAGVGETEAQALIAAAGEAAETLSQHLRPGDLGSVTEGLPTLPMQSGSWLKLLTPKLPAGRVAAEMIVDGAKVAIPAAIVFRGLMTSLSGGPSLSEGCAAGIDAENAKLTGKDNWRKYARAMLFNRAITEGGGSI